MPAIWRGRRRWLLLALAGLGAQQAVLALCMSVLVGRLLSATPPGWWGIAALTAAVLTLAAVRWAERILAEDLGQDYVVEQRRRLAAAALGGVGGRSLGVVVTRASNDLTAVRTWISQGIVPLVTALSLIVVVLTGLALMQWQIAVAIVLPLCLLAAVLPSVAGLVHVRARRLRRVRGRLSAHLADAVRAAESIRTAGAVQRELNAIDRHSARVAAAAVDRARASGLVRALTAATASLWTVLVIVLATSGIIDPAQVASIMTLLGVLATPMSELGRVVEYRQNYRAARRILAPVLAAATELDRAERRRERAWREISITTSEEHAGIRVRGLLVDGETVADLNAPAGSRVVLRSTQPARVRRTIGELLSGAGAAALSIDGVDYDSLPARRRRGLVGLASRQLPLERGSVQRLVAFRVPDAQPQLLRQAVERVGLPPVIERLPKGMGTTLKNDGAPLRSAEAARVKLARALLAAPPLLVLEDIDAELDPAGLELLRSIVADYPGVVLLSSQHPERLITEGIDWHLDPPPGAPAERNGSQLALRSRTEGPPGNHSEGVGGRSLTPEDAASPPRAPDCARPALQSPAQTPRPACSG